MTARAATPVWFDARGRLASRLGWSLALAIAGVLWLGWIVREERHLTPETGPGYWLGVVGAAAMLLLLIYPLRKRLPGMRWAGSPRLWFRLHMALGLFGPAMIALHANFRLGSPNSAAAFLAMLVVMGSGLVGRYFWGRLHRGVLGRRAAARDYLAEAVGLKQGFADILAEAPEIGRELAAFERAAGAGAASLPAAVLQARALRRAGRSAERRLTGIVDRRLAGAGADRRLRRRARNEARRRFARYFAAAHGAASLAVFERLFALWHVLHLPLFVLLAVTAAGHVLAVHLY